MFFTKCFVRFAVLMLVSTLLLAAVRHADASLVCTPDKFRDYGWVENTNTGAGGICCAAATINSFAYLINHYPSVYGDTELIPDVNNTGDLDTEDMEEARDQLAHGWGDRVGIYGERYTDTNGNGKWDPGEPYTDSESGKYDNGKYDGPDPIFDKGWWENKVWWIDDHAPGTTLFDGQDHGSPGIQDWHRGAVLENKYPEWGFLWEELNACEDVELGMLRIAESLTTDSNGNGKWDPAEPYTDTNGNGKWDPDEPYTDTNGNGKWDPDDVYTDTNGNGKWDGPAGHCVTLTRLCFDDTDGSGGWGAGEDRQLRYLDPNNPWDETNASVSEVGGRLELTYSDDLTWYIDTAYSESPIPEPSTVIIWSLLGAFGTTVGWWRRKRKGV